LRGITVLDLEAIELIRQLKSRYFRFLDTGNIEGLRSVFSTEPGIHYRSPSYEYKKQGWDELEAFFRASFSPTKFGIHTGHHPEITVQGDTATGIWYLHDKFVSLDDGITFEGSALYQDRYVKEDGEWKIEFSEYDRLFEEITQRNDTMMVTCKPIQA
jgi:hypothetical protein